CASLKGFFEDDYGYYYIAEYFEFW
nr:immunoglobulin heavy chain junction region [Macaca mulatta]MOV49518.1 immunoglobulin heavy chain junction region [Macaca mulatta]MOV49558.1 immunoglobulin heavy chain junction region [Macaca mulatta]MOV49608.1 immunoglobulin heavy chain junction region [Macaca mulatta]MOV49700.1 immunoglobulin heavy chain junction region [Macaca mulatta]